MILENKNITASLIELLEGVERFQTEIYPENKKLFNYLSDQQSPHTLFITCSDSRIDPTMLMQANPGELFIMRNIGNIVPAYGEMNGATASAIEYAVSIGVSHIIICGHSNCGAMSAMLAPPEKLDAIPMVKAWLRNAEAAKAVSSALTAEDAGPITVRSLSEQNVLLQLAHLRTHPSVAAALARKDLIVQGWFYDIGSGEVLILDENTRHTLHIQEALKILRSTL
ncbi:carbonic anhydrase [Entomobacter blattae]|uniref:carbonic anhydrase n=1 Tax=Entomobacter blattae TaxID=2762277 RepID=A0A7H1NUV7_9PROT|nr:carbonic anhydrase [Entomobacter blattae]QNT79567.1 Carbonic anhydrase 1 [Entomobacter blattae]